MAVFLVIYLILQQQPEQGGSTKDRSAATSSTASVSVAPEKAVDNTPQTVENSQQSAGIQKLRAYRSVSSIRDQQHLPSSKSTQTPANSNRPPPTGSVNTRSELGQLRETGDKTWESTAGLKYGPGSQEKHRLKHVMRHATDQPRRPGKHGVFAGEGEQQTVLALIDEAYLKALKGGPSVEKKKEGQRTVITVDMQRSIGYVGGQVGNRLGKPPAYKIRLVLDGSSVITAFPR